ncbi:MAG: hypothetical protein KGN36_17405, partial [Acidobacteriota bacterium]|nr:hypothetical protein [Acidobacteriota bacterium]
MKPTNEGSLAAERGRRELESGAEWQAIRGAFLAGGDARAAQSAITRMTESVVARACEETLERSLPGPIAVYAVGGFARAALLPYAHPEILVMRETERPAAGESGAEFAARLRERGVLPGVRIHTLAECATLLERNPDLARKLLDRRLLRGDAGLAARFERELADAFAQRGGALAGRLAAEAVARHSRFLDTPSHREPDVKDGPGGARDLALLMALKRLVPGGITASAPAGAAEFLARALCYLHYRAGEERSVLDLEAQQAIAAQFAPGMAAADWLREFFHHARGVYFALRRAIDDRAEEPPAREALRWAALQPLLSGAHAGRALRALESSASLPAAIPEWTRIEGLVDADPDRTLTLDEHTLRAVDALCALDGAEEAAHRRFAELLPDAEARAVLTFALLFHHMGEAA